MDIITIESHESDLLYQGAQSVDLPLTAETKQQISEMRAFYKTFANKAGFAAPQVGILKQIILIENDLYETEALHSDEPVILINPSWKPLSDEKSLDVEGCLSVPGKVGLVERYLKVELSAHQYLPDEDQLIKIQRQYSHEFSCVLWQHEIDHLQGELYLNKAKVVFTDTEFQAIKEQLVAAGKLNENMTLFDMGPIVNNYLLESNSR